MPDYASEVWIMTASGLPLVHRCRHKDVAGDLFAGLVTAITHFAEDIFTEQCQSIKMKSSKLTFLHSFNPDLILLCRSEVKTQERRIISYLSHVRDVFLEEFEEVLLDWKGSMKPFANFTNFADFVDFVTI
jgi:hypothetical protein